MTTLSQQAGQLATAHGGRPIEVSDNLWAFPDGATLRNCGSGPFLSLPPADPARRWAAVRGYHQALLERATTDHRRLDAALRGQANPFRWDAVMIDRYGPPRATAAASLAAVGEVVERGRAALARLDAERPVPAPVFA